MDRTDSNVEQLARDVHFLSAPVRLAWDFLIIFVLLFLSPFIFVAVVFGLIFNQEFGTAFRGWLLSLGWFPPIWARYFGNPLTPDDVWFLKIILCVFGPFAFSFWFGIVTRCREVKRNGHHGGVVWANLRVLVGLVLSLAGVFCAIAFCGTHGIERETSLVVMALGIMSPALLWCIFGLFRSLFEIA